MKAKSRLEGTGKLLLSNHLDTDAEYAPCDYIISNFKLV